MLTKKEQTHDRIIQAAGRGIREKGYGGIGVDGIASYAEVTSGALYAHFGSKEKVFEAAVEAGLKSLQSRIQQLKIDKGKKWLKFFINEYLSIEHVKDLSNGCVLPGLTSEVTRASPAVKSVYQKELKEVIKEVAAGLNNDSKANRKKNAAWLLAMMSGSVQMARSYEDPKKAAEFIESNKTLIKSQFGLPSKDKKKK